MSDKISVRFIKPYVMEPDQKPRGICECGFRFTTHAELRVHWLTCPLILPDDPRITGTDKL